MAGSILLASTAYVASQTFPGIIGGGTVIGNPGISGSIPGPTTTPTLGIPGTSTGSIALSGNSSGKVTIQPGNVAAGTYNYNLPTSAGTAGQPLLSGGGGSAQQTYGTLGVGAGGTNCSSASGTCLDNITGFNASGVVARTGAGSYTQYTDTQLTTHVNPFTSALSGAAPASGGGSTNFLRADGTWQTPPSAAQALVLLNTITVPSAQNFITDTTSFTNTYSVYEIELINVSPTASNQTLELAVHTGGIFQFANYFSLDLVGAAAGITPQTYTACIPLSQLNLVQGSGPALGVSGQIRVYTPASTTVLKSWLGSTVHWNTGRWVSNSISAAWDISGNTSAIDGFEIYFGDAACTRQTTVASGTVKVYGIQ